MRFSFRSLGRMVMMGNLERSRTGTTDFTDLEVRLPQLSGLGAGSCLALDQWTSRPLSFGSQGSQGCGPLGSLGQGSSLEASSSRLKGT